MPGAPSLEVARCNDGVEPAATVAVAGISPVRCAQKASLADAPRPNIYLDSAFQARIISHKHQRPLKFFQLLFVSRKVGSGATWCIRAILH